MIDVMRGGWSENGGEWFESAGRVVEWNHTGCGSGGGVVGGEWWLERGRS